MSDEVFARGKPWLPLLATIAMSIVVLILALINYRAVREWRRSSITLVDRAAYDSAQLLVTALTRDMRGAQMLVLANRDAGDFAPQEADFGNQITVAFTRFPYPESFFVWNRSDDVLQFFNRGNRLPSWVNDQPHEASYPVVVVKEAPFGAALLQQLRAAAMTRTAYAFVEMPIGEEPYQIIARLEYADAFRDRLLKITGFTVNLSWARQNYFPELVAQVARIRGSNNTLHYAILDENGQSVVGAATGDPSTTFDLPLQFFDPWTLGVTAINAAHSSLWKVRVSGADDPGVRWATRGADWTLVVIVITALMLALSFLLMARAIQAKASLANVRADFVAAVTHELKTPLATIRMIADTLIQRRLDSTTVRTYAGMLATESRGLSRLVDNMLAYARVTDVTEVYTFEGLCLAELVDDALTGFQQKLQDGTFEVNVNIPDDLPMVRGDRTALRLAFDNLIDNAIRYSTRDHWIGIAATRVDSRVSVEVRDHGGGIPSEEIAAVQRKFVRGSRTRHAGTGLGLAIVHRVARDHGGHLELRSQVDVGTVAIFDVPIS